MDKDIVISDNTLTFNKIYVDYETFMDETRDPIYRAILSEFKKLKEKDKIVVNVIARHVDETDFESNMEFTKSNLDVLTTVINPYFEKREEYELCNETMRLFSELKP